MRLSQVSLITCVLGLLILGGCSSVKPLEVKVSPVKQVPLVLPDVDPLKLDPVEWYVVNKENAEAISKESFVNSVSVYRMDESIAANRIFPNSVEYKWNTDYYGPLMIPSKGLEIEINTDNLSKYGSVTVSYTHLRAHEA